MSKASAWTARDIPFQDGRRFLVTGANSGIGFHTAVDLARHGAIVLLAARDRDRGQAALTSLRQQAAGPQSAAAEAELILLDLASLDAIRRVADEQLARNLALHGLINNAGVYEPPQRLETVDGFELQLGTNVLGHFALTCRLLPLLELGRSCRIEDAPRVVTVSSIAHKFGKIDFADVNSTRGYRARQAYAQSKLANLMLAFALERRLRQAHTGVISVAAHPGVADTNLFKTGDHGAVQLAFRRLAGPLIGTALNSSVQGALPTLFAATSAKAKGGGYYGPQGMLEARGGDVGDAEVRPQARDEAAQEKLWDLCEQLAGTRFDPHRCPD